MPTAPLSPHDPAWAQPDVTSVTVARDFLNSLQRRDTLFFYSGDGEPGHPINFFNDLERGRGVAISPNIVAATPPEEELMAYHHALGLGPERVFCPTPRQRAPLTRATLGDEALIEQLRGSQELRGLFVRYKDSHAEKLAGRLGAGFVGSTPKAAVYEALNDKLDFSRAASHHGFATLPMMTAGGSMELEAAFQSLGSIHGRGCMLRLRRGVGGTNLAHVATLSQARRIWRRLRTRGEVLVTPFIPPALVRRNIGLHGIATPEGFAPLFITDQIMRGFSFRGGRLADDLSQEEIEAVRASLPGIGAWLCAEGYTGAPAGVDGFLMRDSGGLRFVLVDPNIRMTGSMRPWSVAAVLSEMAGMRFVWQFEWLVFLGSTLNLRRMSQCWGEDLLSPDRLERGGILPSCLGRYGVGPFGALRFEVILLGRDVNHLDFLRRRVSELGIRLR